MKKSFSELLISHYFRLPKDYLVPFGPLNQNGSLMATVDVLPLWNELSVLKKIKAFLCFKWRPDEEVVRQKAAAIFERDVFGSKYDFGEVLHDINLLNHHRPWNFDHLLEYDREKIRALMGVKILTSLKHQKVGTTDHLHLNLAAFNPLMCSLVIPMMVRIPVVSLRFGLEIQENFAFNSIRASKHPQADELVSFLYETLSIQQKLAVAFHRLLYLISLIQTEKGDSSLTSNELEALSECDSIINYLKSSIEKTVLILGLIYGLTDLDSKQKHVQKLRALDQKIPDKVKEQPYFAFVWKFIQSEELDKLNSLRNGINHKRGVSNLQPHSYLDKKVDETPLSAHFDLLFDQHRRNTAILLGVFALLVDDLMSRKPPEGTELQFCSDLMEIYSAVMASEPWASSMKKLLQQTG